LNAQPEPALLAYTRDALDILGHSLRLSEEKCRSFYRVSALQMRMLLCDTTRRHDQVISIALLPRVRPGLRLPALNNQGAIPFTPHLSLTDWLDQPMPIAESQLSVRQFIRQVCDQDGGAHVDLKPQTSLREISEADTFLWVNRLARVVLESALPLLPD